MMLFVKGKVNMKLTLTKKEVEIIRIALFEYSKICFDQGTEPDPGTGYVNAITDKKSISYKLAVQMQKVLEKVTKQI